MDDELGLDVDSLLTSFCDLAEQLVTSVKDAEQRQDLLCQSDACSSMEQLMEYGLSFEDFLPACVHQQVNWRKGTKSRGSKMCIRLSHCYILHFTIVGAVYTTDNGTNTGKT